jgi:predicted RNA methylase
VLIDLGSGLGHVPLLASICTHARGLGIEREEAYVRCARQCAERFRLDRVAFVQHDARQVDLSAGTVFYLYTPFTGPILREVLSHLKEKSTKCPIRVSTFGPCTDVVALETWLEALTEPDPAQITLFCSR